MKVPWRSTQLLEWCWWRGYGNGCGLIRSLRTHQCRMISGRWGRISVVWSQVVEDASVLRDCHVFEWGLTVNQNQKKDYIRKQLRKDTSSIYEKSTRFFTTHCETSALDCSQGVVLTKKKLRIPGSLSLSLLHWKREWEERSGGVGP